MRAGTLRHHVTIQQVSESSANDYGETTVSWTTYGTVWGALVPQGGREFERAKQAYAEMTHLVRTRYVANVDTTMRLKIDNSARYLNVVAVYDPTELRHELVWVCREVV